MGSPHGRRTLSNFQALRQLNAVDSFQRWRSVNFLQKERIIRDSTLSLWHQGPAKVSETSTLLSFFKPVSVSGFDGASDTGKIVISLVTAAVWQGVEAQLCRRRCHEDVSADFPLRLTFETEMYFLE